MGLYPGPRGYVEPENMRDTDLGPAGLQGKRTIGGSKSSFSYACFATEKIRTWKAIFFQRKVKTKHGM